MFPVYLKNVLKFLVKVQVRMVNRKRFDVRYMLIKVNSGLFWCFRVAEEIRSSFGEGMIMFTLPGIFSMVVTRKTKSAAGR